MVLNFGLVSPSLVLKVLLADSLQTGQYHRVFSGGGIDLCIRVFTHRNFSEINLRVSVMISVIIITSAVRTSVLEYTVTALINELSIDYAISVKVNKQCSDCMTNMLLNEVI